MPVGIYSADPGTLPIDDNGNHKDLRVDSLDKYTCVRLSVAILSTIALLSLVLRDDNFLVSALLYDLTGYSSLYITSYDTLVIRYCKYFIESNLAASLTFKLLYENLIVNRNLVLLAACLNYCVHIRSSCSSSLAA